MNLPLLQLGDSALPIGGYSQSWGLEAAVDRGELRDAGGLESWARAWLRFAVARTDGIVVAAVTRAAAAGEWPTVVRANEYLAAGLSPPTLRRASREMGEQLLTLAECWPWAADAARQLRRLGGVWFHPPAFATLASAAGTSPETALTVYLHQAAMGAVGAGVKAVPIGHTHGQQVLASLHDLIRDLAAEWSGRDLDEAGSFCPVYETLCDAQSRLYTRLFRS